MWIFTYPEVYVDSTGTVTKYIGDEQVLMAYSGARCDRYFGPNEQLPMVPMRAQLYREWFGFDPSAPPVPPKVANSGIISPAMFYCDAYVSNDWKKLSIRSQTAPIFATTQTDAFLVMDTEP